MFENTNKGKVKYLLSEGYLKDDIKILEVGSGSKAIKLYLQGKGLFITASDKFYNDELKVIDITKKLPESYDLIFGLGVLHHLEDPEKAFNNLKSYADELIFIEPYKYSFFHLLLALNPIEWTRWRFFKGNYPHDLAYFKSSIGLRMPQMVIKWKRKQKTD